jgi:N-acetylneuraminic acid mutarotase
MVGSLLSSNKKGLAGLVVFLALLASAFGASARQIKPDMVQAAPEGQWYSLASLPMGIGYFGMGQVGGKIYTFGGENFNGYYPKPTTAVMQYDPVTNTWQYWSTMPEAMEVAVASLNGKLYMFGGYKPEIPVTVGTAEEYDPATDTWVQKTDLPSPRSFNGVASYDGKLYVIGGLDINSNYTNTVYIFDPVNNSWSEGAPMPTARDGLQAVASNGKIYAIGGYNGNGLSTVEVFDPVANTWSTKTSMPIPQSDMGNGIAESNGKIYIVGGCTFGGSCTMIDNVFVYDVAMDTWSSLPDLPIARGAGGTAIINGILYAVGGYNYAPFYDAVYAYNIEPIPTPTPTLTPTHTRTPAPEGLWYPLASLPMELGYFGMDQVNGKIYLFGGNNFDGYPTPKTSVLEYNPDTNSWRYRSPMPQSLQAAAASLNGKIYIFGGYHPESNTIDSAVEEYDPVTDAWTHKADLPSPRRANGVASFGGNLYVFGGIGPNSEYTNTVYVFNPGSNVWTTAAPMPTSRAGVGAVVSNGKIYVIGGGNGSTILSTVEMFDPVGNTWSTKTSLPMPLADGGNNLAESNGKIYYVAGCTGGSTCTMTPYVPVYDVALDTWSSLPNLPFSRNAGGAVIIDGILYAVGGYDYGTFFDKVYAYNIGSTSTSTSTSTQTPITTSTHTPTLTHTPGSTNTLTATRTSGATNTPTHTQIHTSTATATPTFTSTNSPTPTPTSSVPTAILSVSDGFGVPGSTGNRITVDLDNHNITSITGAEWWLVYDSTAGITLTNVNVTSRTTGFTTGLTWDKSNPAAVKVHMLLYNMSNATIAPGNGPILELLFDVSASAIWGDVSPLSFSNANLSNVSGNSVPINYSDQGTFTIQQCATGDVTCDATVNIFDLQNQINMILHVPQPDASLRPLDWWTRADLNTDNQWNIFDLQRLINIILGGSSSNKVVKEIATQGVNQVSLENIQGQPGTTGSLGLILANQDAVASGEVWLTYDSRNGVVFTDAVITPRSSNFSSEMSEDASDPAHVKVHILFYNLEGATIMPGNGSILDLNYSLASNTTGMTVLHLEKVLLSDATGNPVAVDQLTDGSVTVGDAYQIYLPYLFR